VANIKSQIKRIKTNEKAVAAGDAAAINTELRAASQSLDVAVQKGVLHKNSAANKKSSMAKAAAKAGAR
jgi:small subunit ribosomal protein S20